jgi:hypothetical protein
VTMTPAQVDPIFAPPRQALVGVPAKPSDPAERRLRLERLFTRGGWLGQPVIHSE